MADDIKGLPAGAQVVPLDPVIEQPVASGMTDDEKRKRLIGRGPDAVAPPITHAKGAPLPLQSSMPNIGEIPLARGLNLSSANAPTPTVAPAPNIGEVPLHAAGPQHTPAGVGAVPADTQPVGPQVAAPAAAPAATSAPSTNPFAGLMAHAENIHNPVLRVLAKLGAGIASAPAAAAEYAVGPLKREEEGREAKTAAETEHEQAATKKINESTPKEPMEWAEVTGGAVDPSHPELGQQQAFYNKTDPTQRQYAGPMKPAGGAESAPLSPTALGNSNKSFQDRYQILNPGQPLPVQYTLPANATKGDFDRVDKMLQQVESAKGTKAQQEATRALQQQNAEEHKREFAQNASRKDVADHDKAYVVPAEGTEKSYQMMNNAFTEYQAAKAAGKDLPTGAQSMLALSTHLTTTFGNVKGARITKDMIEHHLGARGVSDSALVAVQKFTNGDVLSPAQWEAFHDLIGQSRLLSWQAAVREGDRKNIPMDFLPDDLVAVKIPGHKASAIPGDNLAAFQKKYPDAEVLSEK